MILDALFFVLENVVVGLAGLFPTTDTFDVAAWLEGTTAQLGALNYFLPIAELFAAVVGVLVIFPLFMGTTVTLWVFAQVRGSSARG